MDSRHPYHGLIDVLSAGAGFTAETTVGLLFALRIHRSLSGLAMVATRVAHLASNHPEAFEPIHDVTLREGLIPFSQVLSAFPALMQLRNPQYQGGALNAGRHPLRPCTGDSGVADVVLMDAFDQSFKYRQACAVYVAAVMRYQYRRQSLRKYRSYLEGYVGDEMRRGDGSRIYAASRYLRELAKTPEMIPAQAFPIVCSALDATTLAMRHMLASPTASKWQRNSANRHLLRRRMLEFSEPKAEAESAVASAVAAFNRKGSADFARFLFTTWGAERAQRRWSDGRIQSALAKAVVSRGHYTLEQETLDTATVQKGGRVIHVYAPEDTATTGKKRKRKRGTNIDADIEVEIDMAQEENDTDAARIDPVFSLFVSDGKDPTQAYYANRSALHHTELGHALLPMSLTRPLVLRVRHFVESLIDEANPRRSRATLAGLLQLMTGRDFTTCLNVHITARPPVLHADLHPSRWHSPPPASQATGAADPEEGTPGKPRSLWRKRAMVIHLPTGMLYLRAACPHNKHGRPRESRVFFQRPGFVLRLQLPPWLLSLAATLKDQPIPRKASTIRAAQRVLKDGLHVYQLTVGEFRHALLHELLDASRDDLGMAKVVTDSASANLNNIIHYAAYPSGEVEQRWASAVRRLTGIDVIAPPRARERWVGAVISYRLDELADAFRWLRNRIETLVQDGSFVAAHNSFTIYVAYWVQLATAARTSRSPLPHAIDADGWALVGDKTRKDGSAHRLVPLSAALLEQLQIYVAWVDRLALLYPDLRAPIGADDPGWFPLRFIMRKVDEDSPERRVPYVVPFSPVRVRQHHSRLKLPGNWARKVVRAHASSLAGRYLEMGLGHWTRGRHALDWYSTVSMSDFREAWLASTQQLEATLGFGVLRLLPTGRTVAEVWSRVSESEEAQPAADPPPPSNEVIEDLLQRADAGLAADVLTPEGNVRPEAVLLLARETLTPKCLKRPPRFNDALAITDWLRAKTKVPIFASRPNARYAQSWMTDPAGFVHWARVQREILPKCREDLARLPEAAPDRKSANIEIGRMVLIAIFWLGIANWATLRSTLLWIATRKGSLLASGTMRAVEVPVRSARSRTRVRRTILLPPWVCVYLLTVDAATWTLLGTTLKSRSGQDRLLLDRGARAYLRALGVEGVSADTTATLLAAGRQAVLLHTTPLQAAYAAGEIEAEDLPESELRRFADLAPRPVQPDAPYHVTQAIATDRNDRAPPIDDLPDSGGGFAHQLMHTVRRRSINARSEATKLRKRASTPTQLVLCEFAMWLFDHVAVKKQQVKNFNDKQRSVLKRTLQIVSAGLVGFADGESPHITLDADALEQMAELTGLHFPARAVHRAWEQFRVFLLSDAPVIAGVEVHTASIRMLYSRHISAKMLKRSELDRVIANLGSARSFVANPSVRGSARRHLRMVAQAGGRRAEFEKIRTQDWHHDQIRIAPYEGRSLKTESAQRALPLALFDADLCGDFANAVAQGRAQLIDEAVDTVARGHNFFHGVGREIKRATGDQNLGLHHLRHTFASRAVLTLNLVGQTLAPLRTLMPWIDELLIDRDRLGALTRGEPQAGAGLRALSMAMGHLHPSTTLRHYVHSLCLSQFSYALGRSEGIRVDTMFEHRVSSRTSVRRAWARVARAQPRDSDALARQQDFCADLENTLVKNAAEGGPAFRLAADHTPRSSQTGEDNDNTVDTVIDDSDNEQASGCCFDFRTLESWDQELRFRHAVPESLSPVVEALRAIAAIPGGKRGSARPRHPLETQPSGAMLPPVMPPGDGVRNAERILRWLQDLHRCNQESFRYLMHRWLYYSEAQKGALNIASNPQAMLTIPTIPGVIVKPHPAHGAPKRAIILLEGKADSRLSRRSAAAVRWAMTWIAAQYSISGGTH